MAFKGFQASINLILLIKKTKIGIEFRYEVLLGIYLKQSFENLQLSPTYLAISWNEGVNLL